MKFHHGVAQWIFHAKIFYMLRIKGSLQDKDGVAAALHMQIIAQYSNIFLLSRKLYKCR
jgi:hypothetical protein